MNSVNFLTRLYGRLHNYEGVPFWLLTPIRKVVRGAANWLLPLYLSRPHHSQTKFEQGIIISLTSFPARIRDVWMVIETLKSQSIIPEKIILWLSKEQFPNRDCIPQSLWNCEDELFEIRVVDGDIRSHKKYYYAMQEFPNKTIVTCDDDIYYHPDMLRTLVETALLFPHCIVANITMQMQFDHTGNLLPYEKWEEMVKPLSSQNMVQIGAGGVLYPPQTLHQYVLRMELFTKLAPLADDLWLNMMARLQRTPVVQSNKIILPLPLASDAPKLNSINNGAEKLNDQQLHKMRKWLISEGLPDVYCEEYQVDV